VTFEEACERYSLGKPGAVGYTFVAEMFAAFSAANVEMKSYEPEVSDDEAMQARIRGFRNGNACVQSNCQRCPRGPLGSPTVIERDLAQLARSRKE